MANKKSKTTPVLALANELSHEGVVLEDELEAINKHPIYLALRQFNAGVMDYSSAMALALPTVAKKHFDSLEKITKKLDKFSFEEEGKMVLQARGPHAAKEMMDAADEAEQLAASKVIQVVSRCFFIGFFTHFDAYIGLLLQAIHIKKPELFRSIKREISLSDLLEFSDLELVKKDMLDKEIDSFRRESYVDQFTKLESKFEIRTLRDFPEWKQFVEMAQRRNLFTHNDGCVSQQYLINCDKEGVPFAARPKIGDELPLTPEYLRECLFLIGKIGFMLGHVLWRKVLPAEQRESHRALNLALYDLLKQKRWKSAAEYGLFGLDKAITNGIQEVEYKIRIVNTAIALKKTNRGDRADELLKSVDWSACLREFSLARAVLEENYTEAAKTMIKIGKQGELIDQLQYHMWPLFDEFRGTRAFQDAYRSIYGIDFMDQASAEVRGKSDNLRAELDFPAADSGNITTVSKAPPGTRKRVQEGRQKAKRARPAI